MSFLLYTFIILIGSCLIGLTAAVQSWYIHSYSQPTTDGCQAGCATCLRLLVLGSVCGFVVLFFIVVIVFRTSYIDYFALGLLAGALVVVWFPALISGAVLGDLHLRFRQRPTMRRVYYLLILSTWLFFGWLGSDVPALLAQQTLVLIQGPQRSHARVVQTAISGSRTPTYYVTFDDVRYEVPDGRWFRTLHRGDQVDFVHDSADTTAFDPTKAGITSLGILASVLGNVLWAITLGCVIQGFIVIGGRMYRYWQRAGSRTPPV